MSKNRMAKQQDHHGYLSGRVRVKVSLDSFVTNDDCGHHLIWVHVSGDTESLTKAEKIQEVISSQDFNQGLRQRKGRKDWYINSLIADFMPISITADFKTCKTWGSPPFCRSV